VVKRIQETADAIIEVLDIPQDKIKDDVEGLDTIPRKLKK
jgi:hypothetical protein